MTEDLLIITGASGYLGSGLINSCKEQIKKTIFIDRNFKTTRFSNLNFQYEIITYDLKKIIDNDLKNILASCKSIIHTAYLEDQELNFLDSINREARVIYFSSAAVYGELKKIATIHDPCYPINNYGNNKLISEIFIQKNFNDHAVLRIANPYGNQYCKGFYRIIMNKLESSEKEITLNLNADYPGQIIRDFLPIEDFQEQCKKVILENKKGIFNISSGQGMSLENFVFLLNKDFGKTIKFKYTGLKPDEIQYSILKPSV